jgi:hypothetical protein
MSNNCNKLWPIGLPGNGIGEGAKTGEMQLITC